jgi:hypothetical protein
MPIDWNEIKSWVKNTTRIAMKEAEDLTAKGKLKMEIFSLTRQKERYLLELGKLRYQEHKKQMEFNLSSDLKILFDKIDKIEEKIKTKKEELKEQE